MLAENIEDMAGNTTRFAVIGKTSANRTGRDKTSLMFEVHHRPGTLVALALIGAATHENVAQAAGDDGARVAAADLEQRQQFVGELAAAEREQFDDDDGRTMGVEGVENHRAPPLHRDVDGRVRVE